MTDQRKLLAEYAMKGSEEAFRELVTRRFVLCVFLIFLVSD
jgi:hypothetical protein